MTARCPVCNRERCTDCCDCPEYGRCPKCGSIPIGELHDMIRREARVSDVLGEQLERDLRFTIEQQRKVA